MTFEEWYSEVGTIYSNRDIAEMIWNAAMEQAQAEIDRLRMQLVACGVAALSNTPESAKEQRDIHPDYESGSWRDVCDAVDREMALRQKRDELNAAVQKLAQEKVALRDQNERLIQASADVIAWDWEQLIMLRYHPDNKHALEQMGKLEDVVTQVAQEEE